MENIRMVDEAFLLARIAKNKGGGGDGPSRAEFNQLVERVSGVETTATEALEAANGNVFIAEYGVTTAEDILAYIEAEGDFAPVLIKRGNDFYTSLIASKKSDNAVYLRAIGSGSGKYYIFDYTVTGDTWGSKSYGLQELLESGVNIKTINGESVLGPGNINIQGGGGDNVFVAEYGVTTAEEIAEAVSLNKVIVITNDPEFATAESPSEYLVGIGCQWYDGLPSYKVFAMQSANTLLEYNISPDGWLRFDFPIGDIGNNYIVNQEVEIGTFTNVDGITKTLYRKIVALGTLPNTGEKSVPHGISGNFQVTGIKGIINNATGNALPLPLVTLDTTKMVYISCGKANIVVQTASDRSSYSGTVTLEYFYD